MEPAPLCVSFLCNAMAGLSTAEQQWILHVQAEKNGSNMPKIKLQTTDKSMIKFSCSGTLWAACSQSYPTSMTREI